MLDMVYIRITTLNMKTVFNSMCCAQSNSSLDPVSKSLWDFTSYLTKTTVLHEHEKRTVDNSSLDMACVRITTFSMNMVFDSMPCAVKNSMDSV